MADEADDPDPDWAGFMRKAIKTANRLESISAVESKVRRYSMNTNLSANSNAGNSIRLTSAARSSLSNKDGKRGGWVDDAARALLI